MREKVILLISISLFLVKMLYSQSPSDVILLEQKINKMISGSRSDCIKQADTMIHIYQGQPGMVSEFATQIFPVKFTEKKLFHKKEYLSAETLILSKRRLLGMSDGRHIYRNCGYGETGPYDEPYAKIIDFIFDNNIKTVFRLTGVSLSLFYAIDNNGKKLFFKNTKERVEIVKVKDIYPDRY